MRRTKLALSEIVDNKLSRPKQTKLNDVFWFTCEAAVNNCAIDDPTDFDVAPSSRPHDSAYKIGKDQWQTYYFRPSHIVHITVKPGQAYPQHSIDEFIIWKLNR